MQSSAFSTSRGWRGAGFLILAIGWIAALMVYLTASENAPPDPAADYQLINGQVLRLPLAASKREQMELERLGGSVSVRIVEFDSWIATFLHGKRLAWPLAIVAALLAAGCFYLAGLAAEDVAD